MEEDPPVGLSQGQDVFSKLLDELMASRLEYFIKKVKRSNNVSVFKNRNNINRTSEIMPATVSDTV